MCELGEWPTAEDVGCVSDPTRAVEYPELEEQPL